jgi:phosphoribosylformylglycinamidine synthase subunit PurL
VRLDLIKPRLPPHAFWFGEDQARYVVTVDRAKHAALSRVWGSYLRDADVRLLPLGATGGDALTLPGERPILVSTLRDRFEGWLPQYMAGGAL